MNNKKKTTWHKIRKFFNDIHLWLGLSGGIVIFLICLSGTIYTFSSEIQELLQPSLYKVENVENASLKTPEELIAIVEKESGSKAVSILIPEKGNRLYAIAVANPEGKGRPVTYQINPYSGSIQGIAGKGKGSNFFFTMFKLHRWLLMDDSIGRPIVGVATIFFGFGCITGIIIWFPQKIKYWRQGLKIKMSGNWKRKNHDLHNSLGFYAVVFLLIMTLTGLCWSFTWYKDSLSKVLGAKVFAGKGQKELSSKFTENAVPLSVSELIKKGQTTLNYPGDLKINFPKKETGAIIITKSKNGFFASASSDKIQLDKFSGTILKTELFNQKPFNQKIADSIKPLHTGEIFGTFSKIIYFLSCLIATSLPITGTLIWWNKLKKKRKKKISKPSFSKKMHAVEEY